MSARSGCKIRRITHFHGLGITQDLDAAHIHTSSLGPRKSLRLVIRKRLGEAHIDSGAGRELALYAVLCHELGNSAVSCVPVAAR